MPSPQYRNYVFTWNNPADNYRDKMESLVDSNDAQYLVYQMEEGEEGTPHLQGYIEWTGRKTLTACKKLLPKAHWEPRKGTQEQAIEYCTKEDTRVDGPWELGEKKKQSKVNKRKLEEEEGSDDEPITIKINLILEI